MRRFPTIPAEASTAASRTTRGTRAASSRSPATRIVMPPLPAPPIPLGCPPQEKADGLGKRHATCPARMISGAPKDRRVGEDGGGSGEEVGACGGTTDISCRSRQTINLASLQSRDGAHRVGCVGGWHQICFSLLNLDVTDWSEIDHLKKRDTQLLWLNTRWLPRKILSSLDRRSE